MQAVLGTEVGTLAGFGRRLEQTQSNLAAIQTKQKGLAECQGNSGFGCRARSRRNVRAVLFENAEVPNLL